MKKILPVFGLICGLAVSQPEAHAQELAATPQTPISRQEVMEQLRHHERDYAWLDQYFAGLVHDVSAVTLLLDELYPGSGSQSNKTPTDKNVFDEAGIYGATESITSFSTQLEKAHDPKITALIAQRLDIILPDPELALQQLQTTGSMIRALASTGNDTYSQFLQPYLKSPSTSLAVFIVENMGQGRVDPYFPPLVLQALGDSRPEVAKAALEWSTGYIKYPRAGVVYEMAWRIFQGHNDNLKLSAAFLLMYDFHDKSAINYLIDLTRSRDPERVLTALAYLGDSCNAGTPITHQLLRCLKPFLKSPNVKVKVKAIRILGIYSGHKVFQTLLPFLGDANPGIMQVTRDKLHYGNRHTRIQELQKAARDYPNFRVRAVAQELIQELSR